MHFIKEKTALISALFFFCYLSINSADAKDLQVGTYEFPPYFSIDSDGNTSGGWITLLESHLATLGYNPIYNHFPPPRLAKNVIEGRTELTISAHHIAVDNHVFYSDLPVTEIVLNAYHKKGTPPFTSFEDLKNKTVILIRGYAYNGRIKELNDPKNNITIVDSVLHTEAIKRLKNGHADFLLDYRQPINQALKETSLIPEDFDFEEVSRYSVYYVISKKTPDAQNLAHKLSELLKK